MCHLSSRCFLFLFLSASISSLLAFGQHGSTQAKLGDRETLASQVQLSATKDDLKLTVLLPHAVENPLRANVRLVLLSPENVVRAQLDQDVQLHRRQRQFVVVLPRPFDKVPAQEMEMLHWLRVRYEVTTSSGQTLASGIEALRATTADPFVLTAAAGQVAVPGRPYRVHVHVKSNNGQPLTGVQVNGDLVWDGDEDPRERKISNRALTSSSGNATLEFLIPAEVRAEEGDLTVRVKSGLVARAVERSVGFFGRSYLLLDTDKDIYQPGQTLHARTLRFDSKRKAVDKETLDLRIEDEEQTLVFKQTVATDAFGVAHLDWQMPANLRQGSYVIRIGLPGQEDNWRSVHAEKSVRVYRYDLPNFRVIAKPDKTYYLPGQNADITVSAEYLFGKPVTRGKVRVVEESDRHWNYHRQQWDTEEGQVKIGELDRDGHFTAHFDLSKSHDDLKDDDYRRFKDVDVAAYITDLTTGRTEQRRFQLRVTRNPVHVYMGSYISHSHVMPSTFFVSTFYADGRPARCKVELSVSDNSKEGYEPSSQPPSGHIKKLALRTVRTNKYGLVKVSELLIPAISDTDTLVAEARDAKGLTGQESERIYEGEEELGTVEVSTSHTIHKAGDPIEVSLRSTRPDLRLTVQVIREGVVLATQQTKLHKGHGFVTFPYDPRFTDEVGLFAFSLQEEWTPTVLLEGERTVLYPKNRRLDIGIHLDKDEHRPGEAASAHFTVQSPDKTGAESELGVKIVDRAVEERAQADEDFGQHRNWGWWWPWSLWVSRNSSFGGITREDLDHVDLTEPVSPDFDLVAEYILSGDSDYLEILEDKSPVGPEVVFAKILGKQFEPLDCGLKKWNQQGKWARDVEDLQLLGKDCGVNVKELRDPWGTPYRYELTFKGTDLILTVTSEGPDKHFGTADDFQAHRIQERYFLHYGKLIESASQELVAKEGRFIRDRETLQAELLKRGVDFNALTDPWGAPYEVRFSIGGTNYVTEIVSHGEHPELKKNNNGTVVWTERIDYFVKSRERIDNVLTAYLRSGGVSPTTETQFKEILRKAGVDLDELRDPWGHPYSIVFQKLAQYSDSVKIQQTSSSGERLGVPVTVIRQDVRIMSAGPDGKPNTPDDFQVAEYSVLLSEQSAKDLVAQPAPASMSLAANTGAITGIVLDVTGAVIPNATVEVTNEDTGEKRTAKANDMGDFELKDLHPGIYDIRATAAGFRMLEVKAVQVQATNVLQVSFELSVGTTTEMVTVEAAAVATQTDSAEVSSTINSASLGNLGKLHPGMANSVTKSGAMSTPRLRQDFPETMLWEPALVTDRRGHAKLNFQFADNITTWKLTAVGSTKNGELGSTEKDLLAFQPFFVEHDPPRILTQGDEISYPLVLRNYLDKAQTLKASIKPDAWFSLLGPAEVPVHVEAGDAARALFRYRAVASVTNGKQQVAVANSEISDAAQKPVDVHPFGRPLSVTAADVMDQKGRLTARLPEDMIPGSSHARVKVYPNLLAHVVENLEGGLEKPNGCGEQTISSTYPSLLVAEIYAKTQPKPAIALKAQRYLAAGYERLLRYQAESGGFSYWGHGEAADVALTGYALEFLDRAAGLITVDEGVFQEAEQWALQQQGPDGAWRGHWDKNDKDALLLTAYIAETLAGLEKKNTANPDARHASLERALTFLGAHRDLMDEPYIAASYALAAKATGNEKVHADLLNWLRKNVHEQNGAYWMLERNTPFYGWGRTGQLESTALALRALASGANPSEDDQGLIRKGLLFLVRSEDKDGMWYCGQTTVHVLKTLLAMVSSGETGGRLSIRVNGKESALLDLPPTQTVAAPMEVDISALMAAGENRVELDSTTRGTMSVQLVADSYVPWERNIALTSKPDASATSALRFSVEYSNTKLKTGENVECRVRAERLGYRGYGMILGEVGLPPGADVDRESLEHALQGNYSVYRYDVEPDRVILYMWPEAGGAAFSFRFRPRFGMSAETAPSVLYDYYNPESSVTLKPSHFDVMQSQDN